MKKLLILVTRAVGEFDDYWLYSPSVGSSVLRECGENYVLIISGIAVTQGGTNLQNIINSEVEKNSDTLGAVDEIGVALHSHQMDRNLKILRKVPAFQKKYSSSDPDLCAYDGANFAAINNHDENEKVLDAFRYHLCVYGENDCDQRLKSSFIALWNYFSGDKVLEKKLEFLHFCLDNSEQKEELPLDNWDIKKLFEDYQNQSDKTINKRQILRDMRDILLKQDE